MPSGLRRTFRAHRYRCPAALRDANNRDVDVSERLLDAVSLQAGARPVSDQDWSGYIERCVFEGEADLAARMRARPETATLQHRLEQITAEGRGIRLPMDDLVHGDFVLNNMVVRDGKPYLLDAAHAGKGTRAYDLASLLMETTVGGDKSGEDHSTSRLRSKTSAVSNVNPLRSLDDPAS